jgi:hypothetical protein
VAYGEHGQFFFHYTTADTAFRHILPSGELRLSPYSRMRDPLEAKAWHMSVVGFRGDEDRDSEFRRFWELQEWVYRAREQSKLLSLSIDGPHYAGELEEFTRGYARASMWELYADRHAGVCLLFDRKRLTAVLEEHLAQRGTSFHGPVRYPISGIRSVPQALIFQMPGQEEPLAPAIVRHVEAHRDVLFFTKLADWEHEAEYRFVVVTEDDRPVCTPYADALSAVMVGHAFPAWQIASARAACKDVGAVPLKLNWDMGAPVSHNMPLPPRMGEPTEY